jgi:uncharacterized ParB-like nuclease family protein
MKSTTRRVTMSQQERVTSALEGAGLTRVETSSVPALHGNLGTVRRAGYTRETWEVGDLSIDVDFNARGQFIHYSYSGDTRLYSVNSSGGARARAKATRHAGVFTSAELTTLFLRNLDELVTGCVYRCDLVDGKVEWVRYSDPDSDMPSDSFQDKVAREMLARLEKKS